MSDPTAISRPLTFDEYLQLEEENPGRYEFIAGYVYGMVGEATRHNRIVLNIYRSLYAASVGGPCRIYVEDVKVRVAEDRVYYPDVVVDCGGGPEPELIIDMPCLIVEVSSPSTRATDKREKAVAYQKIETLRGYLLVNQDRRRAKLYARDEHGEWGWTVHVGSGTLALPCPKAELPLDAIYEDFALPPLAVSEDDAIEDREDALYDPVARSRRYVSEPGESSRDPWS
jgi:Uma2 family endonuclease